jgi:hypothetical protein
LKVKKDEKNEKGIQGVGICMRGPPVVKKTTGFQDSEPGVGFGGFGAVTWLVALVVIYRRLS